MPELPDLLTYLDALKRTIGGHVLQKITVRSPFVIRSFEPDLHEAEGRRVAGFLRFGKRIVWDLEDEFYLVFHLMIAGRFHWKKSAAKPRAKTDLIAFGFEHGVLMFTEASTKKRASLHIVEGATGLTEHQRGGLEVMDADVETFARVLTSENHTVKRALTDPRLFSGLGNAYSDEILHRARLSPLKWTSRLTQVEVTTLYEATQDTLRFWTEKLLHDSADRFPEKVTAFRPEMAVHGKAGEPCPVCQSKVQRIVYAENETNYCPGCQTGGKVLADRSLSRLLKDDWPREQE